MNENLKRKIKESLSAVLPITIIVLLISIFLVPMEIGTISLFLTGAMLLIVGMGFFQLGAEMSMTPLGEGVGGWIFKNKKISIILIICFFMGVIITIAEPDLQVLANQVPSIPNRVLIWAVALGVGIFTAAAVLRILFKVSLGKMLSILYIGVFLVSLLAPADFIAVAFDAGGVTTGPMTVPFIMALGVGLSSTRSDRDGSSDSFGLIALCSVGPILMVLLLGIFFSPSDAAYSMVRVPDVVTVRDVVHEFAIELPHYAKEVLSSILPVLAVFLIFQFLTHRYHRRRIMKMCVGFLYTIIGLILFLTGVNVGFSPVGSLLGAALAEGNARWLLIPIGMLIGYYIVKAEPAVQVLNRQVETVTDGMISRSSMNLCLSVSVAAAVGLAMVRVLTGISIYWILIPGYTLALLLARYVPSIFVGIAFDSGGVASGPMTSSFLLPLAMGACTAVGGNVVTDAFGIISLVALAPVLSIQIMGAIYNYKRVKSQNETVSEYSDADDEMIELEGE